LRMFIQNILSSEIAIQILCFFLTLAKCQEKHLFFSTGRMSSMFHLSMEC
jgi:hypothetical protein